MTFPKGSFGAAALYYAQEYGWSVFPLVPRDKFPLTGHGFKDASRDADRIAEWWTQHPDANVGIATGDTSGLLVLDVDGPEGESALEWYGELPSTLEVRTGKGRHLYFARGADAIRNSASKLGAKLDVRGDGGYVVAPPSIHPNGGVYKWASGRGPGKLELAPFPAALRDRLAGVVGAIGPTGDALKQAIDVVLDGVDAGGRNQSLAEYVGRLLALGARELEVLELARALNTTKFRPPLHDDEVESVVTSIARAHAKSRSTGTKVPQSALGPAVPSTMQPVTLRSFEDIGAKCIAPIDAIPTPYQTWNNACRMFGGGVGLARGWHTVLAGGAGAGKSLIALNLTAHALRMGYSVGWVSLEMSSEQLLLRTLGIATGRRMRELEPSNSHDPDAMTSASLEAMGRWQESGAQLLIAERPSRDMASVERLMREAIDAGCRLLVLDYLQLVNVPGSPRLDDAMRQVSSMVQSLAYGYEINTLALSQFNRSTTANGDTAPTIHGVAGSSAIENDADQMALIDHTGREQTHAGRTFNFLLEKNRHGPQASMKLLMDSSTLAVTEVGPATRRPPQLALEPRDTRSRFPEGRE